MALHGLKAVEFCRIPLSEAAGEFSSAVLRELRRRTYDPADLGAPATRIQTGARGPGRHQTLQVLAPEQTGPTREAQPQLYWFIEGPRPRRSR